MSPVLSQSSGSFRILFHVCAGLLPPTHRFNPGAAGIGGSFVWGGPGLANSGSITLLLTLLLTRFFYSGRGNIIARVKLMRFRAICGRRVWSRFLFTILLLFAKCLHKPFLILSLFLSITDLKEDFSIPETSMTGTWGFRTRA